jgi:antitoxin YefM
MITTSYTEARERLAELLERTVNDCEVVEIRRRGHESVAMIAMSELRNLLETAYLLRSPKNAERLLTALNGAQNKTGQIINIEDLEDRLKR